MNRNHIRIACLAIQSATTAVIVRFAGLSWLTLAAVGLYLALTSAAGRSAGPPRALPAPEGRGFPGGFR